jgi:hypothetical protein
VLHEFVRLTWVDATFVGCLLCLWRGRDLVQGLDVAIGQAGRHGCEVCADGQAEAATALSKIEKIAATFGPASWLLIQFFC